MTAPAPDRSDVASCAGLCSVLVGLGIALYVGALGWIGHLKYANFVFDDFDLAVHAQSLWALTHGSWQSSILGLPFFGNHLSPILLFLAPVYWILPSPEVLLFAQTLVLGLGAWGLYRLARRELSDRWGLLIALLYLGYTPLIQMNLFEFHPVALATGFLIWMMDAYYRRAFRAFVVFMTLSLLCQENISMVVAAFFFPALIEQRGRAWLWTPLAAGVVYFALAFGLILPAANPDVIQFGKLYAHLGTTPDEVFWNIALHPFRTLRFMLSPAKLQFLNLLAAPLGYLSLLSPMQFIPAVPVLLQRLLSARTTEAMLKYHYQAELIPFFFVSAVFAIKRLLRIQSTSVRPVLVSLLVVSTVMTAALTGFLPTLWARHVAPGLNNGDYGRMVRATLSRVPADAPVVATFEFLPRLANRLNLYSFHHIYTGHYTLSDRPYPMPEVVDWLVVNTLDRSTFGGAFYRTDAHTNLQALVAAHAWEVELQLASLLVLRRVDGAASNRLDLCGPAPADRRRKLSADASISLATTSAVRNIELAGYSLTPKPDAPAELDLYWKRLDDRPFDYNLLVRLMASDREAARFVLTPGHRIWPPQSWPPGVLMRDRQTLPVEISADASRFRIECVLIPLNQR